MNCHTHSDQYTCGYCKNEKLQEECYELREALKNVLCCFFGSAYMGYGEVKRCPNGIRMSTYNEYISLAYPKDKE